MQEINKLCTPGSCIVVSQGMVSKFMDLPRFHPRQFEDNRQIYGTIDSFHIISSDALQYGEFLVVPHLGFVWYVDEKITDLNISLIDQNSDVAKRIMAANPETVLGEKVLLDGREKGIMISLPHTCSYFFKERSNEPIVTVNTAKE